MNAYFEAAVLGILQSLTEFLPISSTAHLIIIEKLLVFESSLALTFDVVLHLGTALAVIWYFRDFWKKTAVSLIQTNVPGTYRNQLFNIVLGTIPAGLLGIMFEDIIATRLRSIEFVIAGLLAGSIIILIAEILYARTKTKEGIKARDGLIIGIFQAMALLPGISRSGATISGGLLLGKERREATRFSFLLATPIIFGATLKQLGNISLSLLANHFLIFITGFLAAFLSGLAAIRAITWLMERATLKPFIYYRVLLALILLWSLA